MAFARQKTSPIREKRVGAVGAWSGSVEVFAKESALGDLESRIRTYAQDVPSDVEHALELLRTIDGLAIVVHGPAGCAAALHGATKAAGPSLVTNPWLVTNLSERDSIMGSDAKLRKAIQEIHKTYAPKAIAVVSTPVVAINNDDIDSVTEELKDELSIPVVAIYTDGFRSKIGSTGQDVAVHSLIKHLLPLRRRAEGTHVNLLAVQESRADVEAFQGLLSELGVESVVFPRFASVGQIQKLSEAKASIALDPDAGEYAGTAFEEIYGIPFLKAPAPIGSQGTKDWFAALGTAIGKSDEAAKLVERESKRIQSTLAASESFRGARVFVNLAPSLALAFPAVARELGLTIVGLKTPWAASRHGSALTDLVASAPETPLLVGEGQAFEEVNLLGKLKPDLYITAGAAPIHALRIGIPVVNLDEVQILGFAGLERLARAIERALANRSLSRFLSEGADEPYDPSWLKKSVHWYIKQEVK